MPANKYMRDLSNKHDERMQLTSRPLWSTNRSLIICQYAYIPQDYLQAL